MNLFLLFAVPLITFLIVWVYFDRISKAKIFLPSIAGLAWSVGVLIASLPFQGFAHFTGNLWTAWIGISLVDGVLIPIGLVAVFAWRHGRELDQGRLLLLLTLWLGILFAVAGIRDFFVTRDSFDLNELFFVPLGRGLFVAWLPIFFLNFWVARTTGQRVLWSSVAFGAAVAYGGIQILSFSLWGWISWILLAALYAGTWYYLNGFYRITNRT